MLSLFLDLIDEKCDQDLFIELYNKYEKSMWYIAYRILNDHHRAEDATQDTFFKIAIHIKTLRNKSPDKVRSYLFIAVRNRAYDIAKKEQRMSHYDISYLENICDVRTNKEIENIGNEALIIELLNRLPQKYTDVMHMHFVLGMKEKEIARVLGRKENTVTQQIFRGRQKFVELYDKEMNNNGK